VIATAVGGVPEVVRDGETGFLCKADDPASFAARIRELLLDRERARSMGSAARTDVLARFARGPIVDLYEGLYRRVLARARPQPCGGRT
jgi:glycosyltransferase involved in cell wall biosynthesis